MHEFNISIICLALTPFSYSVKAGALVITTTLAMLLIKKSARKKKYQEIRPPIWRNAPSLTLSILGLSLLYSFLANFLTLCVLDTVLSFNEDDFICLFFVAPTHLEICIPLTGCLLAAAQTIKTKFCRAAKYPLLLIFLGVICLSIIEAVKEMLHLY